MEITNLFNDTFAVADFLELINRDAEFEIFDADTAETLFLGNVYDYMNEAYDDYEVDEDGTEYAIGNQYDDAIVRRIIIGSDKFISLGI